MAFVPRTLGLGFRIILSVGVAKTVAPGGEGIQLRVSTGHACAQDGGVSEVSGRC